MLIARLIPVLLCSAALVACEGTSEPEFNIPNPTPDEVQEAGVYDENPLLGSWMLTSAADGDGELDFPTGFSLILTFTSEGAYSISVTNTSGNFVCEEPQTSCTIAGTYEFTHTTLTLDEEEGPEPGPDTGLYALCGGRLIYMDFTGEEDAIRFTFKRTRRDGCVGDCT
jgi:hypothetical protein